MPSLLLWDALDIKQFLFFSCIFQFYFSFSFAFSVFLKNDEEARDNEVT